MITDVAAAQEWLRNGISFAGVGVDSSLLVRAADELLAQFRVDRPGSAERSQRLLTQGAVRPLPANGPTA